MLSQNLPRHAFLLFSFILLAEGLAMNFGYIRGYGFGAGGDLDQDYCAAKALLQGKSIYGDLTAICETDKLRNRPELENFHPPVAAVLLLPFAAAGISIQWTFFLWGMAWTLVYAAVMHRAMCDFEIAAHLRWMLLGFALLWFPHLSQSSNGQFSTVILALVFLGGRWLQKDRDDLAGVTLGAATAIKLFPGLLGVYLIATRRFRALAVMIGAFLGVQILTLLIVGPNNFLQYYLHVMPEDSRRYAGIWMNQSFTGTMIALLRQNPYLEHLADFANLAPVLVYSLAVAMVAHAWLARRGSENTHRYWHFVALSVILCPVSWDHTAIILAPLCILLLARFGNANKLEWAIAVVALMAVAQVDDLTFVREVIAAGAPKIPLSALGQARAQLWCTLGVTAISAALLSYPQLAQRKSKKRAPVPQEPAPAMV